MRSNHRNASANCRASFASHHPTPPRSTALLARARRLSYAPRAVGGRTERFGGSITVIKWMAFWASGLSLTTAAAMADATTADARLDFHLQPTADTPIIALAMNAQDADEPALEASAAPAISTFGMADTWRLNFQAGGAFAIDEDKDTIIGLGGVGVSYFVIDNVSLELELNMFGFDQPGKDALGLGFNVIVRWHFIAQDTWSIYIDGGAGMLGTTANVPPGTISFNFMPQAGLGVSFEIAENTRAFIGARLHHISNANIGDTNSGLDNFLAYAGVSFPF